MTLAQDLGIAEVVFADFETFSAGGSVAIPPKTIDGYTVSDSVVHLPSGPAGTGYQVIGGSLISVLGMVFVDGATLAAGAPLQIAEKVGNTWIGHTLTLAKAA